jgi:putative Mg2+ transporter-C (MgtC) family protein
MVEGWIDRMNQIRNYKIVCSFENETLHRYEDLFKAHHLKFRRSRQCKTSTNIITGEWVVQGKEQDHRHCIHEILRDTSVQAFEF